MLTTSLIILLAGCGIHSPERVREVAAEAAVEPERIRKLVAALGDREREVWEEAYGALLSLGPAAVPYLRDAVERRRPEAGRALLVLGALGEPEQVPLLRSRLGDSALDPFARSALELAERSLYERIEAAPELGLIDGYLYQFPRGPHVQEVSALRRELVAWGELEALGDSPAPGALIRIDKLYGDTAAGRRARELLARQSLVEAGLAIAQGRGDAALQLVQEARDWDPALDVTEMEAAARAALGLELVGRNDLDGAIAELEASWALRGSPSPELGELYLQRARRSFKRRQVMAGMADLRRAEAADPSLAAAVDSERASRVPGLIEAAARPGASAEVCGALLLAGRSWWASLEELLRDHLGRGEAEPLLAVTEAAWRSGGPEEQGWLEALLTQLIFELDASTRALLGDEAALADLVDPPDLWSAAARGDRREAVPLLSAYVGVVAAAHQALASGGELDGALPAAPPRDRSAVTRWLMEGRDPRDPGLPRLDRAQLILELLDALDDLDELARSRPAELVGALAPSPVLPVSAAEWARWYRAVELEPVPCTIGGRPADVAVLIRASTIRIELETGAEPLEGAALGDAVTALLASARPLLAAEPGASRVELVAGTAGPAGLAVHTRLSLTRQRAAALDWDALAAEAPLGPEHRALLE